MRAKCAPRFTATPERLWVDWIDAQSTVEPGEMAWTRLDARGQWEPVRYRPFDNGEQRDYLVRGGIRMQAIAP